jgi:type III secretion system IpaD/SipD/SspD family effector
MSTSISLSTVARSSIIPSSPEQSSAAEAANNEVGTLFAKGGAEQLYKQASDNLLKLNGRLVEARKDAMQLSQSPHSSSLDARAQALSEKIVASQLHSHVVTASLQGLAALVPSQAPQQQSMANAFFADSMPELQRVANGAAELLSASPAPLANTSSSGSDDFFSDLLEMIKFIKDGYLGVYEDLITKYSAFFKEFNESIMSKMGGWIEGANDGKEVKISGDLRLALNALIQKYSGIPGGVLFTGATEAEALKWAAAFGSGTVRPDGNGGFVVMMDLSPLQAMSDSLAPGGSLQWDSAKFQAWQTGFNSQESELKNQLQVFTTKYGNANSYYENFNKILSSQLSQYADMLKAYLTGIGG